MEKDNTFQYPVQSEGDVFLTIYSGQGHLNNSALKNFDGHYIIGQVNHLKLGKGNAIKGQKLLISSIVTDTNDNTNLTSITYTINGVDIKTYSENVATDNSSIYYTTTIEFI